MAPEVNMNDLQTSDLVGMLSGGAGHAATVSSAKPLGVSDLVSLFQSAGRSTMGAPSSGNTIGDFGKSAPAAEISTGMATYPQAGGMTSAGNSTGSIPGYSGPSDPGSVQALLSQHGAAMFGADQVQPLLNIVNGESGFNPAAANPGSSARGLFQFLDSTAQGYGLPSDASQAPVDQQIAAGLKYIKDRYGTPANAWQFWQQTDPAQKGGIGGHWY
jgi:hypothetical protein